MSEVARDIRSRRQVWAAPGSSHDTLIGTLRVVLPIAIGVLAAFLVLAPLTSSGDVSFVLDKNKVEVAKERLKIQSATYRGQDGKGQPFSLTAGSAVQRSSAEPVVQIQRMAAELGLPNGPTRIVAPAGRYDMDTQQVTVPGDVAVRGADGLRVDTSDATLDMKTRRIQSRGAVTGATAQGTFSGDRMSADIGNDSVRIDGNARLRIVPRRAR